jgi:hypothetical protein
VFKVAIVYIADACMQIGEAGRENNYSYELQCSQFFPQPITIKDGDMMVTTCMYDSMGKKEPTPGGLGSQEEMCINFLVIYPATCGACQHTYPFA